MAAWSWSDRAPFKMSTLSGEIRGKFHTLWIRVTENGQSRLVNILDLLPSQVPMLFDDPPRALNSLLPASRWNEKWLSCAMLADGDVIGVPYNAAFVLRIHMGNDSTSTFGSFASGGYKWWGAVRAATLRAAERAVEAARCAAWGSW